MFNGFLLDFCTQRDTVGFPSAYRLVGDDQLDNWQSVEHGDGGNVPGEETIMIRLIIMVIL